MSWYSTGTVAMTAASGAVVGTGTNWVANVQAGDIFWGPDGRGYEVAAVISNTSLTIGPVYAGATAGGQAYRIAPTQGRVITLTAGVNQLLTDFGVIRDGIGAGRFPNGTAALPAIRFGNDEDTGLFLAGANSIAIATAGVEGLRVNSLGNVGLGITAPTARLHVTAAAGTPPLILNSDNASDNSARSLQFHLSGQRWCDMYVVSSGGGDFAIATGGATPIERLRIRFGSIRPGTDNSMSLGEASKRWSVVYAGTGAINTSDAREKTWRSDATPTELAAARRIIAELGFYQWNDAIAEKGVEGARLHFGLEAQAVWAIMADEGLIDAIVEGVKPNSHYAFLCYDEWDAETDGEGEVTVAAGNRFGVRPDQLALFLLAAQEARIAVLEAAA